MFFFISDSSTIPLDNVYCNVASIFVIKENRQTSWSSTQSICKNSKNLIHYGGGSVKKGVSAMRNIVLIRILIATNKHYKAWK